MLLVSWADACSVDPPSGDAVVPQPVALLRRTAGRLRERSACVLPWPSDAPRPASVPLGQTGVGL